MFLTSSSNLITKAQPLFLSTKCFLKPLKIRVTSWCQIFLPLGIAPWHWGLRPKMKVKKHFRPTFSGTPKWPIKRPKALLSCLEDPYASKKRNASDFEWLCRQTSSHKLSTACITLFSNKNLIYDNVSASPAIASYFDILYLKCLQKS